MPRPYRPRPGAVAPNRAAAHARVRHRSWNDGHRQRVGLSDALGQAIRTIFVRGTTRPAPDAAIVSASRRASAGGSCSTIDGDSRSSTSTPSGLRMWQRLLTLCRQSAPHATGRGRDGFDHAASVRVTTWGARAITRRYTSAVVSGWRLFCSQSRSVPIGI